jgi:hypothetical protein
VLRIEQDLDVRPNSKNRYCYEVETVHCQLFCILYNSVLYMFRPLGHHQKDNLVSMRGNALQ